MITSQIPSRINFNILMVFLCWENLFRCTLTKQTGYIHQLMQDYRLKVPYRAKNWLDKSWPFLAWGYPLITPVNPLPRPQWLCLLVFDHEIECTFCRTKRKGGSQSFLCHQWLELGPRGSKKVGNKVTTPRQNVDPLPFPSFRGWGRPNGFILIN